MNFNLENSIQILERTPAVLDSMLLNISEQWTACNEGSDTWSAYDIVGHLIFGEKTDWVPRMDIILSEKPDKKFEPYDRFAQFRESKGKNISQLLNEFKTLRGRNVAYLRSKQLTTDQLLKKGIHPAFGNVTLAQLLSTWTVHDLNHIAQIARVMAKQYKSDVGPWVEYLGILK
ncbi:MAG TPA: DinB family protein [Cyclobacteriaceae bacterium]|nr:DinB family protein [Cyclobacteriaceae bacterium]